MNRNLKMAVVGSGLTNYQIEQRAGIPLTKLSRIIHGAVRPSEKEMETISRVLEKLPRELFLEPIPRPPHENFKS